MSIEHTFREVQDVPSPKYRRRRRRTPRQGPDGCPRRLDAEHNRKPVKKFSLRSYKDRIDTDHCGLLQGRISGR